MKIMKIQEKGGERAEKLCFAEHGQISAVSAVFGFHAEQHNSGCTDIMQNFR